MMIEAFEIWPPPRKCMNTACEYYDEAEPDGSSCIQFQYPSYDECEDFLYVNREGVVVTKDLFGF